MRPGITFRRDYDAARLRRLARISKSAAQGRCLLALAEIYDCGWRTKAARVGGVGSQTIRNWVLRFNAPGPEGPAPRIRGAFTARPLRYHCQRHVEEAGGENAYLH